MKNVECQTMSVAMNNHWMLNVEPDNVFGYGRSCLKLMLKLTRPCLWQCIMVMNDHVWLCLCQTMSLAMDERPCMCKRPCGSMLKMPDNVYGYGRSCLMLMWMLMLPDNVYGDGRPLNVKSWSWFESLLPDNVFGFCWTTMIARPCLWLWTFMLNVK